MLLQRLLLNYFLCSSEQNRSKGKIKTLRHSLKFYKTFSGPLLALHDARKEKDPSYLSYFSPLDQLPLSGLILELSV